ncbi:hypothetical protein [Parafrankia irregularis]|uniref:hypothetical protein n=1 Tax=Parafrankia irregularis TaxID=795642 RepID=UPI0010422C1E|nr:hypothetical protein [Parafrankia irregularis]
MAAALIGAVGTVAAVWLALFLQITLVERRRPVLSLDFSDDYLDQDVSATELEDLTCLTYRIRVYAEVNKETARNVEVLLLRARRPENAVNGFHIPDRSFRWTGQDDRKVDIPPGSWRRLDFLSYIVDSRSEPPRFALLAATIPDSQERPSGAPLDRRWYLDDPGTYEFEIAVTAEGMNATGWKLRFQFNPGSFQSLEDLRLHVANLCHERISIS